jgi:Holliday junction resolvasome RuvABC DNA-binding subunit
VGALVALGYSHIEATAVVRAVLDEGEVSGVALIKAALTRLGQR